MEIPVGFAQVNFVFGGGALPYGAEVTLGIDVSNQSTSDQVFSQAIAQAWVANILPSQVSTCTLEEVRVKYGPNATGRTVIAPVSTSGGISAAGEPPNTAVLVQKLTAQGGRAGRGRFYIPCVGHTTFDSSGLMDSTAQGAWQTQLDDFGADLATALAEPVVLHAPDSPIAVPSVITSFAVAARAGTQRRRMRR